MIHHSFTEVLKDNARKEESGAFPVFDSEVVHGIPATVLLRYMDTSEVPQRAITAEKVKVSIEEEKEEEHRNEAESGDDDQKDYDDYHDLYHNDSHSMENDRKAPIITELRMNSLLLAYVIGNLDHHLQ